MATLSKVPKDLVILVCDSRKALLLRNAGGAARPELEITEHIEDEAVPADNMDTDRAGRRYDAGGIGGSFRARSAMEANDYEKARAEDFASRLVDTLSDRHRQKPIARLLIAAPPIFLGILRGRMSDELRRLTVTEVPKRLTELPVGEIQKALVDAS